MQARPKAQGAGSTPPLEDIDLPRRLEGSSSHGTGAFDGPINGEYFLSHVEQVLVPSLRPRDVVVMDNLGSHKVRTIKDAIAATGARLVFLPAYSPDLNPIEQIFSKFKCVLRRAMGRTVRAVENAIAEVIPTISPTECKTISQTLDMPQSNRIRV
ncbi:MAG: transposase [Aestuariivirga sp.]